jgi:hypothetical protein
MLGDGVYFFEDSFGQAKAWARSKGGVPFCVFQATVRYGRCLRLVDTRYQKMVKVVWMNLESHGVKDVTPAVAINALAEIAKFDTVRAPRRRSYAQSFMGSSLDTGLEILLCVKTLSNIVKHDIVHTQVT